MGILDKVIRGDPETQTRSEEKYLDLSDADVSMAPNSDVQIHFAEISSQQDTINVKDALYDGDIVFIDLKFIESAGLNDDQIIDQLNDVVDEINGDIVQRGDDVLIATPNGVSVSRQKI